jgi:hypothetical protein
MRGRRRQVSVNEGSDFAAMKAYRLVMPMNDNAVQNELLGRGKTTEII